MLAGPVAQCEAVLIGFEHRVRGSAGRSRAVREPACACAWQLRDRDATAQQKTRRDHHQQTGERDRQTRIHSAPTPADGRAHTRRLPDPAGYWRAFRPPAHPSSLFGKPWTSPGSASSPRNSLELSHSFLAFARSAAGASQAIAAATSPVSLLASSARS